MARETKTVQCYPNDSKINTMIKRYEAFGWELINNQRCQEYEGTYDGYKHWSTFNKLTFSREKSSSWYGEIVDMEARYEKLMNDEPVLYASEPSKIWILFGIVGIVLGIVFWLFMGVLTGSYFRISTLVPTLVFIGIGALLLIIFIFKRKKYKNAYDEYNKLKRDWESTSEAEAKQILKRAEAIINDGDVL